MRVAIQRVRETSVTVSGETVSQIRGGLLVYVGCATTDTEQDAEYLAQKTADLRIFPDDEGKMNRNVLEAGGGVLVVSAFTLQADARKGRRPSFDAAAAPDAASALCEAFIGALRAAGLNVCEGRFGAYMLVQSVNDGPVCILLDSKRLF